MEQIIKNPDSGSVHDIPASLNYETKGDARLVSILYRKVEEIEKEVHELKTQKIIDETQLPMEILESSGLLPEKPKRLKTGKAYRPLLQSELEEAMTHGVSHAANARWLGVSYSSFMKYSKMYGIWVPGFKGRSKNLTYDPDRGKYSLNRILTGEFNGNAAISDFMVKRKLLMSKTFEEKCNICGYETQRAIDKKVCLLLDHKDGDRKNFKLDNLQLLCLNCTFECGRGYIRRGTSLFDPDWNIHEEKLPIISPTDE